MLREYTKKGITKRKITYELAHPVMITVTGFPHSSCVFMICLPPLEYNFHEAGVFL